MQEPVQNLKMNPAVINCTRCGMLLYTNCRFCPGCGQGLHPSVTDTDPLRVKRYRIFLVAFAIFIISESLFFEVRNFLAIKMDLEWGLFTQVISYSVSILFYVLPAVIAFLFPPRSITRILLLIMGGLNFIIKTGFLVYELFFQENSFTYFNF